MLTLQECLEYCELTEAEIEAIAEHEHLPPIVAAELGDSLLKTPEGVQRIRRFILDDIAHAEARGRFQRIRKLRRLLERFDTRYLPDTLC